MRIKVYALLCCLLAAAGTSSMAQYRVKKVTREDFGPKEATINVTVLDYSGDQLVSIRYNNSAYPVIREKKNIIFGEKKQPFRIVGISTEGVTAIGDIMQFGYGENGKLNYFQYNIPRLKSKQKYNLYYNENDKLVAISYDGNMDNPANNFLLYYDQSGRCTSAQKGMKSPHREVVTAKWNNERLVELSGYHNPFMFHLRNQVVSKHIFFYDENGNVIEEKLYKFDPDKDTEVLICHCLIEYEPGKGDEKDIYFNYRNWKTALLFNQASFIPYIEVIM